MHIDVRGPWPMLIVGVRTFELTGVSRQVTIEDAVAVMKHLEEVREAQIEHPDDLWARSEFTKLLATKYAALVAYWSAAERQDMIWQTPEFVAAQLANAQSMLAKFSNTF